MYYYVSVCISIYYYVSVCIAMYQYVSLYNIYTAKIQSIYTTSINIQTQKPPFQAVFVSLFQILKDTVLLLLGSSTDRLNLPPIASI